MFRLAGQGKAEARAAVESVFAQAKALAENSLDNVSLRDPQATDHKTTIAELQKLAPRFDWTAYFDAARIPRADLNVTEPKFLQEVDRQLAQVPPSGWKTYLKWKLLASAAPELSAPFVEEDFRFNDAYLGGRQGDEAALEALRRVHGRPAGRALGRKYTERHFPPEARRACRRRW